MNRGRTTYMKRFYGIFAGRYDQMMDLIYGQRDWEWREAAFATLSPSDRVLEVGAGTGRTERCAPAVRDYISLDISSAMLSAAPQMCNPVQADVHILPFPGGTFDVIIAILLMSTRIDQASAVREMARVMRPGGQIILVDKFSGSAWHERALDRLKTWLTYPLAFDFDVDIEGIARMYGLSVSTRQPVPRNLGLIEKVVLT